MGLMKRFYSQESRIFKKVRIEPQKDGKDILVKKHHSVDKEKKESI